MPRKHPLFARSGCRLPLLALLLVLLASCATTPPPTGLMDQAVQALDQAQQAGAADYAPLELGFATKKLDLAQSAMGQKDYDEAAQLAEESQANSSLARVKSELASVREKIKTQSAENQKARQRLDAAKGQMGSTEHGGDA